MLRAQTQLIRPRRWLEMALVTAIVLSVVMPRGASASADGEYPGHRQQAEEMASAPVDLTSQSPATYMAGQLWMIKSNDLVTIGGIGRYQWVGCGLTTAPQTPSNYSPCQSGQVPIYTNYQTFETDVSNHVVGSGDTVIFDNESWRLTPRWERKDQVKYEELAARLANQNGITFINTPYGKTPGTILAYDTAAARYASVVEIQAQGLDRDPHAYRAFVRRDVAAIRAINATIPILAGLATDAGGTPTSAQDMYEAYKSVKDYVQGFWLNANTWTTHAKGCAAHGCAASARAFLRMIGVSA